MDLTDLFDTGVDGRRVLGIMTDDEVALAFGVKAQTLEAWRARGQGPVYVKVGRSVFYRPEDIREWLATQRKTPGTDDTEQAQGHAEDLAQVD